jgi:hypothetical protein
LVAPGVEVAVEYPIYDNLKKVKTVKGMFTIKSLFSDTLIPGTFISITNETGEQVTVEPVNLKLIAGKTPVKLAGENGIRPDGKDNDAPKRRGRKPKDRSTEEAWSL